MSSTKQLIGSQLGRYRIVEHLATGGMAEIFLARHDAIGRFRKELVLKVLQTRWEGHPEIVDLFLGEARLSALMEHPNIVDVFDVAEEDGRHFIVMEYIAGKTLTDLAKRAIAVTRSVPVEVGVFIAAEIAGALAYMYDGVGAAQEPLHVVHRDISPTNVIVGHSGQVKLIDFGIARQGPIVVEEGNVRPGKVTYMSPEQVTGAPIDGRSDIFCLGTILYEITLGRRLWRGPREVASKRIVEERPKPPTFVRQDYPPELELIVLRALEKKPEDRYQTAAELHNDLHNYLERAKAHLRNNCQMADYVAKIFSPEADGLISDAGRQRAQAFGDGVELAEPEQEDLDFDVQQLDGPGAALARALRTSALGIWAELDKQRPAAPSSEGTVGQEIPEVPVFSESSQDLRKAAARTEPASARPSATRDSAPSAAAAKLGETSEDEEKVAEPETAAASEASRQENTDELPLKRSVAPIVIAVAVIVAAVVGAIWWLSAA